MACEYCSGGKKLYQHTYTTKLWINRIGKARTIETECNPCPQFAQCCVCGVPARSAFLIKFCPECGEKLVED